MTATPRQLGSWAAPRLPAPALRSQLQAHAALALRPSRVLCGTGMERGELGKRRRAGETRSPIGRQDGAGGRSDSRASQDRLGLGKLPCSPSLGEE